MKELKQTISNIVVDLTYYANVYLNLIVPREKEDLKFMKKFRLYASRLRPQVDSIPFYNVLNELLNLPSKKDIHNSVGILIFLSNVDSEMKVMKIDDKVMEIRKLLRIEDIA